MPENPAVPELETGPEEAVLVHGHRRARRAVLRRTRSATAVHHRGQALVPRVEDSEAAVGTMPGPAATEAAVAWAAAVTAEAAAALE